MKRAWLLRLLTIAFIWVVVSRWAELGKLAATLAQARWQWVLAAALLQSLFCPAYTALYQVSLRAVGVQSRLAELVPVMFASVFVSVAAPATGTALWVDDAVRRGESGARAAAGTVLVRVADFGTFAVVLMAGLVFLYLHHELKAFETIGAGLLLLIIGGWAALLLFGLWFPSTLGAALRIGRQAVNWLGQRLGRGELVGEQWADEVASDFTEAARAITARPRALLAPTCIGLACQVIDLASFYTLFLAFGQSVGLGVLVAGFAVGILFWIVAITPQGIGVVEGVMPLALSSLGIPPTKALTITLAFRGLGFWLPLAIGFVLLRRVRSFGDYEGSRPHTTSVGTVALLTAVMGVVNLLSAVTPGLAGRLGIIRQAWPLEVRQAGHLAAAVAGFALIMLANGLARRKRAAWILTLAVLVVSMASHLVKGLDYEEAVLAGALAVWLVLLRPEFHAASDMPSVRQGLGWLFASSVLSLAYGAAGFYLLDRHFSASFGLAAALRQTLTMFAEFRDPGLQPLTGFGRYFAQSIYLVAALTLAYSAFMLIRPVLVRAPASREERARARAIVEGHGRSSLARLALLPDKQHYFSQGGSLISFAVRGRTAVVLGDPIGPAADARAAIAGFGEHCRRRDWQAAYFQVLPDYLDLYGQAGLQVLCIGHEAVVHLEEFSLAGKAGRSLRTSVNRLTRLGYRAELHAPPLPDELLEELRRVSDEWLTSVRGSEKRFSLGWFDDEYVRGSPVMVVYGGEGRAKAFANIVPEYQCNEVTIDLMRHRRAAEHGTMDFLFVSLFEWARGQGYDTFNLGLSPLAGVGEAVDDRALERVLHYVYENISWFYDFRGVDAFKRKFRPQRSPRYLVYPSVASLPAVWTAILRAQASEGSLWGYLRH